MPYSLIVKCHAYGESLVLMVRIGEFEGKSHAAEEAMKEFSDYFDEHRIYLPEPVCARLSDFDNLVRNHIFKTHLPEAEKQPIWDAFQEDGIISEVKRMLEEDFRAILDGEEENHHSASTSA